MTIAINQTEIDNTLMDKLNVSDIKSASINCKKGALKNRLMLDILCRKQCSRCSNCITNDSNVVIPEGNVNADIMFVCEQPTEIDCKVNTVMFDAQGRVFTVILEKLGMQRDNVYITPVIKCSNENYNNMLAINCASSYLLREIALVKPKKIVAMGTTAINVLRTLICNKNQIQDVLEVRGQVINTVFDDNEISILQTISTDFLLTKAGSLYKHHKINLWNDITEFIK